jgi:hypothetical protein
VRKAPATARAEVRPFAPATVEAIRALLAPRHAILVSLLLHEGRSVIYVARQLGHSAKLTMDTYGHVVEEL